MIFNYHPILGLQYYTFENEVLYLDIDMIPKTFDFKNFKEQWIEWCSKMPLMIENTKKERQNNILPIIYTDELF